MRNSFVVLHSSPQSLMRSTWHKSESWVLASSVTVGHQEAIPFSFRIFFRINFKSSVGSKSNQSWILSILLFSLIIPLYSKFRTIESLDLTLSSCYCCCGCCCAVSQRHILSACNCDWNRLESSSVWFQWVPKWGWTVFSKSSKNFQHTLSHSSETFFRSSQHANVLLVMSSL